MVAGLPEEIEHCADPAAAAAALERICAAQAGAAERLADDPALRSTLITVLAASPWLARLCAADRDALGVLADLRRPRPAPADADELARWKRLELLRIAALDLDGLYPLDGVVVALSDLADGLLGAAYAATVAHDATGALAVVGMGKLGARELNYASDIDIVLAGEGDPRPLLGLARRAWRVDLDLRPEGRSGPLVRTLASYLAYWDRWADTWEFQALLKARPVAGDPAIGAAFAAEAAERVWGRPFGADELRQLRDLKGRAERQLATRGLTERELKRGKGGIRDVEFAVQLLQLVHGRADPTLRSPSTLSALGALSAGGYVAPEDATALEEAYRFLRTVEHRLQLQEDQQVHTVPTATTARSRLARVLGFRDIPAATAQDQFDQALRRHQATVRSIHERLFFRPLLEAFSTAPAAPALGPEAVVERLAAFGFSDAARTRLAVTELTRGFSRASRLLAQLLPLLLEWCSAAPDADQALLGLRTLLGAAHHRARLTALCRESPEAARQLCMLLGTGPRFTRDLERHPDLLSGLAAGDTLAPRDRAGLEAVAERSLSWRTDERGVTDGLRHLLRGEQLRIAARDALGHADVDTVGRDLTALAEVVLGAALRSIQLPLPVAVIAMGRLGGAELAYASDLDVLLVHDGSASPGQAAETAAAVLHLVNGDTPARRLYTLDLGLRPEGRQGPLSRSLDAYAAYYRRWAQPWERQALVRGRFVAGDAELGRRFAMVAEEFVWGRPFDDGDVREIRRTKARVEQERIPAGEDPQFHLKLGRGSLSDIEWTAQLLQLRHGVRATGTVAALEALAGAGALDPSDARVLADAYRFCERARNRLNLVRDTPGAALPATGPALTSLARSLGTTPPSLRDEYRRVTRRARQVVERLFYGKRA